MSVRLRTSDFGERSVEPREFSRKPNGTETIPHVNGNRYIFHNSANTKAISRGWVTNEMALYTADSLKSELNQRNFRMTPQRKMILQVFQTLPLGEHLSVEALHHLLESQGKQVSLSTVYRTVNLMVRIGILRELELAEGHKHYELNQSDPEHHHHLICLQCHRTIEFKNSSILKICREQAAAEEFEVLDCQLTLHAVCLEAVEQGWPFSLPKSWSCSQARGTEALVPSTDIDRY